MRRAGARAVVEQVAVRVAHAAVVVGGDGLVEVAVLAARAALVVGVDGLVVELVRAARGCARRVDVGYAG